MLKDRLSNADVLARRNQNLNATWKETKRARGMGACVFQAIVKTGRHFYAKVAKRMFDKRKRGEEYLEDEEELLELEKPNVEDLCGKYLPTITTWKNRSRI